MVSCLVLLHRTHVFQGQVGDFRHTACGLGIPVQHADENLFAADPAAASCEQCQSALEAQGAATFVRAAPFDPKAAVIHFLEQVVNLNDAAGWANAFGEDLRAAWPTERLNRLHELFPGWRATVDEVIAEGDRVVVRYQVVYTDPYELIDAAPPTVITDQVIIVRLSGQQIVAIRAVADDFWIWREGAHRNTQAAG